MFSPYPASAILPTSDTTRSCIQLATEMCNISQTTMTQAETLLFECHDLIIWEEVLPGIFLAGVDLAGLRAASRTAVAPPEHFLQLEVGHRRVFSALFADGSLLLGNLDKDARSIALLPFGLLHSPLKLPLTSRIDVVKHDAVAWLDTVPQMRRILAGKTSWDLVPKSRFAADPLRETFMPWWLPAQTCNSEDIRFLRHLAMGTVCLADTAAGTADHAHVRVAIQSCPFSRRGRHGQASLTITDLTRQPARSPGDAARQTRWQALKDGLTAALAHPDFPVPQQRMVLSDKTGPGVINRGFLAVADHLSLEATSRHTALDAEALARTWLAKGQAQIMRDA